MSKACSLRSSTSSWRSSRWSRALQKTQPAGAFAARIQAMRHGAHRRLTSARDPSRVDELAQALADLEEGNALLGNVHGAAGLGVAALAGVAVTDAEAAEAPQLHLVPLGEGVGDVVEHRVDDGLRLLLGEVGDLGDLVDQLRFRHLPPPSALRVERALGPGNSASFKPRGTLACPFRECQRE